MKHAWIIFATTLLYALMSVQAQRPNEQYEKIECYVFKARGQGRIPLYHQYSSVANDDFYTTDVNEAMRATNMGFSQPVIACYIYRKPRQNTVKLFRMYNATSVDHFYTISRKEVRFAETIGYVREGFVGYVYPEKYKGAVPFFRFFTPGPKGNHRYAIIKFK